VTTTTFSRELLAQFDVLGKLGEGGMAQVWLARQRSLERKVALKFMSGEAFPQGEALERFVREARMLAKLDHPNITTIYDIGVDDGRPYLVLEYVSGESVRDRLARDARMGADESARTALFVGRGLAYAHERTIVHRDVKPENVLLSAEGGVKLLDFGLGRVLESSGNLTRGGIILGTPAYLAPELILGSPPSPSSDIYSLGVLLFEMLAGTTPFGDSAEASALLVRTRSPVPDLLRLRTDLSTDLARIVTRTLAPDPKDRWPHLHMMVEALEVMLGVSTDQRLRRPSRPPLHRPGSTDRSRTLGRARPTGGRNKTLAASPGGGRPSLVDPDARARRNLFRHAAGLFSALLATLALILAGPLLSDRPGSAAPQVDVHRGLTGLRVSWTSATPYAGSVAASAPGVAPVLAREEVATTRHDVVISGLARDSGYSLKVASDSDVIHAALPARTARDLVVGSPLVLEATGPGQATLSVELNIPASLKLFPSDSAVRAMTTFRPETSHRVSLLGAGPAMGLLEIDLKLTTVEGTEVRRTVPARGVADFLADYVRGKAFLEDLGAVDAEVLKARGDLAAARAAAAAVVGRIRVIRDLAAHLPDLAEVVGSGEVVPARRARLYEILSELARFDRIGDVRMPTAPKAPPRPPGGPARHASDHRRPAARAASAGPASPGPASALIPLVGVAGALARFAEPGAIVPAPAEPPRDTRNIIAVPYRNTSVRIQGQNRKNAEYVIARIGKGGRVLQDRLAFDAYMSGFTKPRVRLSVLGRCLAHHLFVQLVVNGDHRLRFFGEGESVKDLANLPALVNLADETEFNDRVARQALSLTVPASLFHVGHNQFELTIHPVAPEMAALGDVGVPAINFVYWAPVP
jgi:serine/threonine protein kinase